MSNDHRLQIVLAAKDITGQAFTKLQGRMTALTKSVFSLRGATVALAGAAGMSALLKSSLGAADQIGKTADKLGITTDALQTYHFMASQSGLATKTMEMAMQRFTRRMAEAAQGKGELKSVLEQYNIAVRDTAGYTRKSADVLGDLANVIQKTEDPTERLRIAFKAFDSEGVAMVNTMKGGKAGLDAMAKEARDLGLIMDQELIRASEKANDELDKLTKVVSVHFKTAIVELAPAITQISKDITDWTKQNNEDIRALTSTVGSLASGLSKLWDLAGKVGEATGVSGMIRHAADIANGSGYTGSWMEEGQEALNRYKTAMGEVVNETNRLVEAKQKVTTATMAEAEAMAAVYQQEFDVTVQSYTTELEELAAAEAAAAREMANFQQQVDEMNGIISGTSTWDLMQDAMKQTADVAAEAAEEVNHSWDRVASTISGSMTDAILDVIDGSKKASEAFADMARDIIRNLMKMILQQLIFNVVMRAFGGGGGGGGGGSLFGYAKGGVFDQSGVVPFAKGGVVTRPTIFPFASGAGLMGEDGPEAIMPLTRTSGGDLGVKSEGGGNRDTNVIINAIDSRSFDEAIRRNSASIVKVVDNALISNMSLRQTMRRTL